MSVERIFRLTPPDGEPFFAAVISAPIGLGVVSNRGGKWADETQVSVADLVMPEQRLSDWDVDEIPRDDARLAALKN